MSRVLYLLSYAAVTLYKLSESGKRVKYKEGSMQGFRIISFVRKNGEMERSAGANCFYTEALWVHLATKKIISAIRNLRMASGND